MFFFFFCLLPMWSEHFPSFNEKPKKEKFIGVHLKTGNSDF